MDKATKSQIESFAWDCTIGAGRVGEDEADEPDQDALDALKRILRRPLTGEDVDVLVRAWEKCLMEAAFP